MTYQKLLTSDRKDFVHKIFCELVNNNNASSKQINRENIKSLFLQSVGINKELSDSEKQYCNEKFNYNFELKNVLYKLGKSRECDNCRSMRYSDRFCEKCIGLHLQRLFNTWTSGDDMVDNFIQECQISSPIPSQILEWIPYEQFENVKKLKEGGFNSIYTATWKRGTIFDYNEDQKELIYFGAQPVVLKCTNKSKDLENPFFDEISNYRKIRSNLIVNCFGMTKFPDNGNYAMVLNYCKEGNLRDYLQKVHSTLTLKDRLKLFRYICTAIYDIHEKNLIHCDLHSGNILIEGDICYITDLGSCGPVDEKSSDKLYGIVSYMAPELFSGKKNRKNRKEIDIYSVGMLMWEIFAGHPPFDDRAHNHCLILNICEGLRPPILSEMPVDCTQIMQKCLDADPTKRPNIIELFIFSNKMLEEIYKLESFDDTDTNNKDANKKHPTDFNNDGDGSTSSSLQQVHKSHPNAYHTSRILDDDIDNQRV